MLTAHHIYKTYGIQPILEDISFSITNSERVGLIGPNGCGKTTLMRILAGLEQADSGTVVSTRPNLRIGYLAQGIDFNPEQTLQTTLSLNLVSQAELESEIASLASALASNPNDSHIQTNYDSVLRQISSLQSPLPTILTPLGLADIPLDTPIKHLSGGQKTRLMLARVLLEDPHLLLLDEPTNHLDIEMLEWLEDWLARFNGAALIVSHDRAFLNNTVNLILDLDPETHTLRAYKGNYTDYLEQYLKEQDKQLSAYRDQQDEIKRMRQDINRTKQQSLRVEMSTTPRQPGVRRIAKKVAKKALSREKKLERYLDSDERVENPKASWQMKLEFESQDYQSKNVLTVDNLSVGYDINRPLLTNLNLYIHAGQRIAVTGPNGAGKTTLIRTIAGKLKPLTGSLKLGTNVKLGYMAQEQELLNPNLNAFETIQSVATFNETEARNFLHYFLFKGDDSLRPTSELSFGERARLQLGLLVAQGCTFLLLDEPINHLDIPARARFEDALASFKGTILAVVHDRYFIQRFASDVWTVKDGKVEK
jgi:ATP-binding cassette, subfamily F, member 3